MKKLVLFLCFSSIAVFAAAEESKTEGLSSLRFILNEGQAYDQETKLTWSRCSAGTNWKASEGCVGAVKLMGLDAALVYAHKFGAGWRVPTIDELYSIIDQRSSYPVINTKVFRTVKNSEEGMRYWSRTHVEEIPSLFYFVDFSDGLVDGHTKRFSLAVLLVRSER